MEDYKILIESNPSKLSRLVNGKLEEGYLLSGGVSMVQGSPDFTGESWKISGEYKGTPTITIKFMQAIYKPTLIKIEKTYIKEDQK